VPLVWVINPESHTVTLYQIDRPIRLRFEADELSGEHVIPGFRCPIREILPLRVGPGQADPIPTGHNGPAKRILSRRRIIDVGRPLVMILDAQQRHGNRWTLIFMPI
jgi:hypothetical protein